ncbi:uncharacterized protein V1510DRAFT_410767 [Dipodascopsis tothii]|uniref:uncharacterized protein n=1 Tax=Dipodascopsis tothii TaxID=44089 RepID=UPI0034CDFCC5
MKTVLLVFLHGFMGTDNTFDQFPRHLQNELRTELGCVPGATGAAGSRNGLVEVQSVVYPRYATSGELAAAVESFLSWLTNTVIDREVAKGTRSPVVDPSVAVVLVGHSMGGVVACDSLMAATSASPAGPTVFPHILGVLCFDSPLLGLAPQVVAHGVLDRGVSKFNDLRGVAAGLPLGAVSSFLFAKGASETTGTRSADANRARGRWKLAAGLGAAAAVAAVAGGALYANRDKVAEHMDWIGGHLAFAGALFEPRATLERRVAGASASAPVAVFYTSVADSTDVRKMLGRRTFCVVPDHGAQPRLGSWTEAANTRATDEIDAHVGMFNSGTNPGYGPLVGGARRTVLGWTTEFLK